MHRPRIPPPWHPHCLRSNNRRSTIQCPDRHRSNVRYSSIQQSHQIFSFYIRPSGCSVRPDYRKTPHNDSKTLESFGRVQPGSVWIKSSEFRTISYISRNWNVSRSFHGHRRYAVSFRPHSKSLDCNSNKSYPHAVLCASQTFHGVRTVSDIGHKIDPAIVSLCDGKSHGFVHCAWLEIFSDIGDTGNALCWRGRVACVCWAWLYWGIFDHSIGMVWFLYLVVVRCLCSNCSQWFRLAGPWI